MKKIGVGSLSFVLAVFAFIWSYDIFGFCLGDRVLSVLNIPCWSNGVNANGLHYTVFYSFLLLVPSIMVAVKYKHHFLSQVGKWLSMVLATLLIVSLIFKI